MDDILLNCDFIDYVSFQMQKKSSILEKLDEYKRWLKKSTKTNEEVEKLKDTNEKIYLQKIIGCYENMSIYENAFAYYLGMKHTINMEQLEK